MVNSLNCSLLCDMVTITWRVSHVIYACMFLQTFMIIYVLLLSQDPPPSSTPPLNGYNISHNITGSVKSIWTNETIFVLDDAAPGAHLFAIVAMNAVGEGKQNNCSIAG